MLILFLILYFLTCIKCINQKSIIYVNEDTDFEKLVTSKYDIIILSFLLTVGPWDIVKKWSILNEDDKRNLKKKFKENNKKVLVSVFGSTEIPTTMNINPLSSAKKISKFVKENYFDGVDIDWEDSHAFENGKGEEWLIELTKELRKDLNKEYIITHAPQAPYFIKNKEKYRNGAYWTIESEVGKMIDWYNIQYYNQGSSKYENCKTLINKSDGWSNGTSLSELIYQGLDPKKIVIGKPISKKDVYNSGYISPIELSKCFKNIENHSFKYKNNTAVNWNKSVFGWQFSSDTNSTWIKKVFEIN